MERCPRRQRQVAIVGAGVIGLSVATQLVELYSPSEVVVTLISDQFSPCTTSDKAGCILIPFDVRTNKGDQTTAGEELYELNIKKWTRETFKYLRTLYNSKDAGLVNIQMVHGYYGDQEGPMEIPWWADLTDGFRRLSADEIKNQCFPNVKRIFAFNTYILACIGYLPWLMSKFKDKGGIVEKRKIHNLSELNSYDVIVNCTGLGAAELMNDTSVYPVRGDTVTIKAPWIKQFFIFIDTELMYIFPRAHDVLLGGTKIPNVWSQEPDMSAAKGILERCTAVVPSIATAELTGPGVSAGLRPARNSVRFELEEQRQTPVIHCYGHGGQGIVLHWGCALDVVELIQNTLKLQKKAKL